MMHEVEKFDWPPLLAWNGTISTKVTAIERSRYVMHVAMVAKFLDLLIENVTFIMTFLCMITLRVKLVDHTFRLSFNNANGRLCPKRLLKWRDVVTMVTWRHTPPFFPLNACLTEKKRLSNGLILRHTIKVRNSFEVFPRTIQALKKI